MATIPPEYNQISKADLLDRIAARKAELGSGLCILGHHYQCDDVIQFADFTGDSLKLSQQAAEQRGAKYVVFCGVHFMAESADILSGDDQIVCLPNLRAGCGMADMADEDDVTEAIESLKAMTDSTILPITYVNSTAAIKAVTARNGGACCTSSNVKNVFRWALQPAESGGGAAAKIFAIPDQHLGRNTAVAMGFSEADCIVYDPAVENGGLTAGQVAAATFILWKGFCYVHQIFTPEQIAALRRAEPDMKVIVHPECPREVVALADAAGSTEQIIRAIADAPAGGSWAVGTESNLVQRLNSRHSDKKVRVLSDTTAICVQMAQIDLPHLLWCLDAIADGRPVNHISVPPEIAADARIALRRMIDIKPVKDVS